MKEQPLLSLHEIFIMKEAFYSCQIEGINKDITFAEYMKNELDRRTKKNVFLDKKTKKPIGRAKLAKKLEGDNKYIGDYYIHDMGKVCTVFYNSNPNLEKGHLPYPFLYYDKGVLYISAYSKEDWYRVSKFQI